MKTNLKQIISSALLSSLFLIPTPAYAKKPRRPLQNSAVKLTETIINPAGEIVAGGIEISVKGLLVTGEILSLFDGFVTPYNKRIKSDLDGILEEHYVTDRFVSFVASSWGDNNSVYHRKRDSFNKIKNFYLEHPSDGGKLLYTILTDPESFESTEYWLEHKKKLTGKFPHTMRWEWGGGSYDRLFPWETCGDTQEDMISLVLHKARNDKFYKNKISPEEYSKKMGFYYDFIFTLNSPRLPKYNNQK